jgi:hypothetical protein
MAHHLAAHGNAPGDQGDQIGQLSTTLLSMMTGVSLHGAMASNFSAALQFSCTEHLTFWYESNSLPLSN